MAQKHELMAKLQAARQNSAKILSDENRKAFPEANENRQLTLLHLVEELKIPDSPPPPEHPSLAEAEGENEKEHIPPAEKVSYTTISVPKQYGHKAKLYATLLKVNMVEFTCRALDTYIHLLQEEEKLPKLNL